MADDRIDRIDHLALTARSIDATCAFYERALGFRLGRFLPRPPQGHRSGRGAATVRRRRDRGGTIARHGARGAMKSLCFRDPDANLVEVSRYDD